MWPYVVTFLLSLFVDLLPFIGPPVWTVLVFMLVKYHLNPWGVLAVGVPASVLGRYGLSLYSGRFFGKVVKKGKTDDMRFVGSKLNRSVWRTWPFVLMYSLLPLSTTALFSAAGVARIKPFLILPPFFVGKFISDAIMVFSGRYAVKHTSNFFTGALSWKSALTIALGLVIVGLFLFLDWRRLLERKQLRLNFHIWR